MASSTDAPGWASLAEPDATTERLMQYGREHSTELVRCGVGWDAVVIAPLERGLAALDVLDVPVEAGFPVLADYFRRELVVQVEVGAAQCLRGVPGIRLLSAGSWLLVPVSRLQCHSAATWLSSRGDFGPPLPGPGAAAVRTHGSGRRAEPAGAGLAGPGGERRGRGRPPRRLLSDLRPRATHFAWVRGTAPALRSGHGQHH